LSRREFSFCTPFFLFLTAADDNNTSASGET